MSPGVGVMASGRRVGGGGSSVTVEEVQTPATLGPSASGSYAFATTLVPTDVVLVVRSLGANGNLSTQTINGSSLTAVGAIQTNGTGGARGSMYYMTGLTGSHSLTYATSSLVGQCRYTLYVIRGLTNPSNFSVEFSTWSSTTTSSNTDEGPAAIAAVPGQIAVFLGIASSGSLTFPSNPTPSTGWVVDRADGSGTGPHNAAHLILTSSVSVQANLRSTSGTPIGTTLAVLG